MEPVKIIASILSICIAFTLTCTGWAADVEISEFMADNGSTITDSYSEYSDWIELHNTTASAINLNGWYLTDDAADLTQWEIPDVSIPAGGYMLIFASGENDRIPGSELHTNFKLGANGEYLALVGPDGTTIIHEYTPNYPSQIEDYSYGVIGGVEYFFAYPTPGSANIRTSAGSISFSVESGTFVSTFQVTLTAESPTATVYYTTNGSEPTTGSAVYSSPITVSSSTYIRAIAAETGMSDGPVCGAQYIKLAADVQNFSSNLPLVIIDTWGQSLDDETDTPASIIFLDAGSQNRTTLSSDTDYAGRTGIHLRGTSSQNFPKKQYKVELWDESNEDTDANLFGLGGESDWVLHAPYSDKTYMRNDLTYKWSAQMGNVAMESQYCEVFFNDDGDGQIAYEDYSGIYMLIEKIKIDPERCDTTDMPASPGSATEFNGGFIIEKETSSSRLPDPDGYFNPILRGGDNWVYRDPAPPEMTTAQKTYVKAKIDNFESIIWYSSTRPYYNDYCDGANFVDFELLQQLSSNNDGWYSSAYVWLRPDDKLVAGPVWDFNIAYGNVYYGTSGDIYDWQDIRTWGWWPKLFADNNFSQAWTDRWGELRRGILSDAAIDAAIDERVTYLAEAEARDHARWPVLGEYVWPNPDGYESRDTWAKEIDFLKNWIHGRAAWIDSQFLDAPTFSHASGVLPAETAITMNASTGTIYYTLDGSDPRLPGGSVSGGAQAYTPGGYATNSLVLQDAVWSYNDTGTDLGTAWRMPGYNDSTWTSGSAELGYGDGDEDTVVSYGGDPDNKYPTTYFRRTFNIDDASEVLSLTVSALFDDAIVVYINGSEIMRENLPTGTITYSTFASATATEDVWVTIDAISPAMLVDGENVIAAEIHQRSSTSSDISFNLMLSAIEPSQSSSGIEIQGLTHITARTYNSGSWSAPNDAYYTNDASGMPVVTEINYNPYDPTDGEISQGYDDTDMFEFIEIYNQTDSAMNLDGFTFTDGIYCELDANAIILSGDYGLLVSDADAFEARYGNAAAAKIIGIYDGSLKNSGERLIFKTGFDTVVMDMTYSDGGAWPGRADGNGSSLDLVSLGANPALADSWESSDIYGGTPGEDYQPVTGDIVINEVLTHTDLPEVDYIELYNTTGSAINLGGWMISDEDGDYDKFIAPGDNIPAGGYIVYDEYDFNSTGMDLDPSNDDPNDFGLNSYEGEDVWVLAPVTTALRSTYRFVDHVSFDAAENGVSFGRWPNGTGRLYPMSMTTNGYVNSGPKIGPVSITEIMYMPTSGDANLEFIEIYNLSSTTLDLDGWMIDKGVTFEMPTGYTMPGNSYVVIAPFDPADSANATLLSNFMTEYGIDSSVEIIGGWDGTLSDDGERVRLVRPDEPPMEAPDFTPYLTVDDIDYLTISPWPDAAGNDMSMQRYESTEWGDAPANWFAATATPASAGILIGDADLNGTVNIYDFLILRSNYGTKTGMQWQHGDFTGDGAVNIYDFLLLRAHYGESIN